MQRHLGDHGAQTLTVPWLRALALCAGLGLAWPLQAEETAAAHQARFEWHLLDWVQRKDIQLFESSALEFVTLASGAGFSLPDKIRVYVSPRGFKASYHGGRQNCQLHISVKHFVRDNHSLASRRKHDREALSVALHELSHALFNSNFAPKPPRGIWPEYEALESRKQRLYRLYSGGNAEREQEASLLSAQQALRQANPQKFDAWYRANRANGSLRLAFEELFADLLVTIYLADPRAIHQALKYDDHTESPHGTLRDFTQGHWSDDPEVVRQFYQHFGGPEGALMQKPHYQLAPLRHQIWQNLMVKKSMQQRFASARELLSRFEREYFQIGAITTGKTLDMNILLRDALLGD